MKKKVLGEEHLDTMTSMNNLDYMWKRQGRDEEAFKLMVECIQIGTRVLGTDHPYTHASIESLEDWGLKT